MLQVLYDTNCGIVLQWQDTSKYNYAEPAQGTAILEVTQEQFNNQNGQWYVVGGQLTQEMPLNYAQAIQLGKIKISFNQALTAPYNSTVVGKEIDYNQTSLLNVQGLINYMQSNPSITSIQFRCADNSFVTLTFAQLQSLLQEMISHGLALYQKKWQLESQIQSATTVLQVQSIVWGD